MALISSCGDRRHCTGCARPNLSKLATAGCIWCNDADLASGIEHLASRVRIFVPESSRYGEVGRGEGGGGSATASKWNGLVSW